MNYAKIFAVELIKNLVDETEKTGWLIDRGVEELTKAIEDVNFEVGGIMDQRSKRIRSIATPEDGSVVIQLIKQFTVKEPNRLQDVVAKCKNINIPEKFARFVSFTVPPSNANTFELLIICKITVPSTLMSEFVGSDPVQAWKKSITEAEKFAKTLLNKF